MMMTRAAKYVLWGAVLLVLGEVATIADQAPMGLLDALATGQVEAVFYGNGDQSVRGRIRRSPFGPQRIIVEPGTQFQAQQPGLQGMTTVGWVPIDLSRRAVAYVDIPTACTNYNLPAPTRQHRMIAVPPPAPEMVVLTEYIARVNPPRAVAQLAVWAIANNPHWEAVAGYVKQQVSATDEGEQDRLATLCRRQAAQLLWECGLNPARFAMFQGADE